MTSKGINMHEVLFSICVTSPRRYSIHRRFRDSTFFYPFGVSINKGNNRNPRENREQEICINSDLAFKKIGTQSSKRHNAYMHILIHYIFTE